MASVTLWSAISLQMIDEGRNFACMKSRPENCYDSDILTENVELKTKYHKIRQIIIVYAREKGFWTFRTRSKKYKWTISIIGDWTDSPTVISNWTCYWYHRRHCRPSSSFSKIRFHCSSFSSCCSNHNGQTKTYSIFPQIVVEKMLAEFKPPRWMTSLGVRFPKIQKRIAWPWPVSVSYDLLRLPNMKSATFIQSTDGKGIRIFIRKQDKGHIQRHWIWHR